MGNILDSGWRRRLPVQRHLSGIVPSTAMRVPARLKRPGLLMGSLGRCRRGWSHGPWPCHVRRAWQSGTDQRPDPGGQIDVFLGWNESQVAKRDGALRRQPADASRIESLRRWAFVMPSQTRRLTRGAAIPLPGDLLSNAVKPRKSRPCNASLRSPGSPFQIWRAAIDRACPWSSIPRPSGRRKRGRGGCRAWSA